MTDHWNRFTGGWINTWVVDQLMDEIQAFSKEQAYFTTKNAYTSLFLPRTVVQRSGIFVTAVQFNKTRIPSARREPYQMNRVYFKRDKQSNLI